MATYGKLPKTEFKDRLPHVKDFKQASKIANYISSTFKQASDQFFTWSFFPLLPAKLWRLFCHEQLSLMKQQLEWLKASQEILIPELHANYM